MTRLRLVLGGACWAAAAAVGGFDTAGIAAAGEAIARPLALPFLWRSLRDAAANADPAEAFAKARQLLAATPGWTDGQTVFAFRYALDGGDTILPPQEHARAAADRLRAALAMLEAARPAAGRREIELLSAMAWLVELAVRLEPAIAAALGDDPAAVADRYLAEAEARGAGRMVQEQRLAQLPRLCAAMLRAGEPDRAVQLLEEGMRRCDALHDSPFAAPWRATLDAVRRCLRGDPGVDRAALLADERLQPLAAFLR